MLTGIHFLLTYKCLFECDHCFVYSSPHSEGTFTYSQVCNVLDEAKKIGTIEWIYFEGGEPFLYYPLLLEAVKSAAERGFKTGIVTNGYFATSERDAERWLKPFAQMKIGDLSLSDDTFHNPDAKQSYAKIARRAARRLGIKTDSICINEPHAKETNIARKKGEPVTGGDVMFRGRAADKLAKNWPRVNWKEFSECSHEDLINPERVHVDAFGTVQLCQGISIGNMWQTPLSELVKNYSASSHPVCKLLIDGGPARLAEEYEIERKDSYIDACQLCYETRKKLIDKFPDYLAPKQVYGLNS